MPLRQEPSTPTPKPSPPNTQVEKTKAIDRAAVAAKAASLGFDVVGIAKAHIDSVTQERFRTFLGEGFAGDMRWLADKADRRADPRVLWPEAQSVIAVGMNYGPGSDPRAILDRKDRAAISVYAQNRDYHDVIKTRLKALARWLSEESGAEVKVFVDTAPVLEKPLAQQAGIGWQGKHTNLVSRAYGSWLFLGEVFTSLALTIDAPETDHCGACHACLDACPTRAFPAPYRIDARRCISYLTIEHKGHIDRALRPLMGNRIYGCDDCLAVCPWNKFANTTTFDAFVPRAELTAPRLNDLVRLDDAAFRTLFSGSPIKRIGRDRFVRNVLIAIGNSGMHSLMPAVEPLLKDASPLVRAMAVWAVKSLGTPDEIAHLQNTYRCDETDADVRTEWAA
ncbi:MAG: tRNA epoxyqueuosine(34) reductase QueG [Rhodobacteraceae bacterium]|nr:tRNA epoxyqueuosine(34) reductase QueG [Paracoccaceae bacterium]